MWRSWARVIRGRLPAIGRQDGAILRRVAPGPPPAHARDRGAVGGSEPCRRCMHPGVIPVRRSSTRRACERRAAAAGWQVPAEPTMPRLNSQVLDYFILNRRS